MIYLFCFEFTKYFEVKTTSEMLVDLSRSSNKLNVNLDITMHHLPCQILAVDVKEEEKFAQVIVPDDQLSLAIGKSGQNARLAARLTNWKIDIKSESQFRKMLEESQTIESEETEAIENVEDVEETVETEENNENA